MANGDRIRLLLDDVQDLRRDAGNRRKLVQIADQTADVLLSR